MLCKKREEFLLKDKDKDKVLDMFLDTIQNGDCISELKKLPDSCVDLVFADPPYNLQLKKSLERPNQTKVSSVHDTWDKFSSFEEYDRFTESWLKECRRVLKDTGTIWVCGSYHNIFRVGKIIMDLGFWILNDVHWFKTNPMPNFNGTRFANATETMIWAKKYQNQPSYTFNYLAMKYLNEDKQMQNVWEIPICSGAERLKTEGKKAHSTQKPEAVLFRVITSSTEVGDIVLDPFSGTGTTAAVAKKLGRRFIGIEKEKEYVKLSQERLASVEKLPPTKLVKALSRKDKPRVKFGSLIEQNLLHIGGALFTKDKKHTVVIQADGSLRCKDGFVGSIHTVGKHLFKKQAANGWDIWYFLDTDGVSKSIDALRELVRVGSKEDIQDASSMS